MARRKPGIQDGPGLFDEQTRHLELRSRRQRALFIPKLLRAAAAGLTPQGDAREQARVIAVKWADLESRGKLQKFKETTIDTQFLDQLFGQGLGYRLKSQDPDAYQLEHKFTVPDVGTADAALGDFPRSLRSPAVVIELKDAGADLDRTRFNGRTAVQQCWDYLNALPDTAWGIVSNFRTIRLYHRGQGTLAYEEFALQDLRIRERFNDFYYLFERDGLLASPLGQPSRAALLLERTQEQQKQAGDALYGHYQRLRVDLIEHLKQKLGKDLDAAIRIAQKLLDRIVFIAFCEDRFLLREKCIDRAWSELPPFTRVTNPRWRNFLDLFSEVDSGGKNAGVDQGYNGQLFKPDPELDSLQLDDEPWTNGFRTIGTFDFSEEVHLDVLGHLFERSVTELEKLRVGGLFALRSGSDAPLAAGVSRTAKSAAMESPVAESPATKMPKSPKRKRFGIYYTPPSLTGLIVARTVDVVVEERFAALRAQHHVDPDAREPADPAKLLAYWTDCLAALESITVCDPACGSGAFLIRAFDALDAHYKAVIHGLAGAGLPEAEVKELDESIPDLILEHNLFGVDLSHEAVEITQLALWIRSARPNRKLTDLSRHILCGNSLVSDPAVDPKALDWQAAFPQVFGDGGPGGFTCVIGNPPWERVKVQDREFFSLTDPVTAEAVSASDRKKRIAAMPQANPELHESYLAARDKAQKLLDYARNSERYPLTGKGDVNLYMLFAELARALVAADGMAGLLVPSGIATDETTKEYFSDLMESKRLALLYDFENRERLFEDVDSRFKFSALVFGGAKRKFAKADFVFFARCVEDTDAKYKRRHIPLTAADMALVNPNTKTCPIFRTRKDAELTKRIYKRIPILIDENRKQGGNPWGIKFLRMFDQTNDADHFQPAKAWQKKGYKLEGNVYKKQKKRALPLYEAKMVQAFDHRAASVVIEDANWVRQGQKAETSPVQHQNPEFCVQPRWWVDEAAVAAATEGRKRDWLLAYKDVTSATNERTMIASFLPWVAVVNSAPLVFPSEDIEPRMEACLLANLNAFVFDYVARQKVGSVHLNFFIVEQLPALRPDAYADKCPWAKRQSLESWISERALKLTCTAEDMLPLAKACGFKGSRGDGVQIWKDDERAHLRAELDAAYFHLYGIEREDVQYILSTFTNTGLADAEERGEQQFLWRPGSPGELILEAFDRLA